MEPLVLYLLRGLLLVLLYLFVWRVARSVLRDVRGTGRAAPVAAALTPAARTPSAAAPGRAATEPPADASRSLPRELVVHIPGQPPRVLELARGEISFGRARPSTVVIDDPYVSDRHARVWHDGSSWVVGDLGSTNGTYLNQRKVSRATPLAAGDQLGIGKTVVEVRR